MLKMSSGLLAIGLLPRYLNLRMKDFSSGVVAVMVLAVASARAYMAVVMPEKVGFVEWKYSER